MIARLAVTSAPRSHTDLLSDVQVRRGRVPARIAYGCRPGATPGPPSPLGPANEKRRRSYSGGVPTSEWSHGGRPPAEDRVQGAEQQIRGERLGHQQRVRSHQALAD